MTHTHTELFRHTVALLRSCVTSHLYIREFLQLDLPAALYEM